MRDHELLGVGFFCYADGVVDAGMAAYLVLRANGLCAGGGFVDKEVGIAEDVFEFECVARIAREGRIVTGFLMGKAVDEAGHGVVGGAGLDEEIRVIGIDVAVVHFDDGRHAAYVRTVAGRVMGVEMNGAQNGFLYRLFRSDERKTVVASGCGAEVE